VRRALWFGLLAAPLAWSLQELLGYGLSANACGATRAIGTAETVVAVAALLVAGAALVVARSSARRVGAEGGSDGFMAAGGTLVSGLFLFGIVMNLAGYLLVPSCG
jgi:hypothetical protein